MTVVCSIIGGFSRTRDSGAQSSRDQSKKVKILATKSWNQSNFQNLKTFRRSIPVQDITLCITALSRPCEIEWCQDLPLEHVRNNLFDLF